MSHRGEDHWAELFGHLRLMRRALRRIADDADLGDQSPQIVARAALDLIDHGLRPEDIDREGAE